MFTPVGPSEAWQALREWLNGFDDDSEGRIRLIDESLTGDRSPDVKFLHLLRWLDPTLPPHYLGLRLLPEDLPALAAPIDDPGHPDHYVARGPYVNCGSTCSPSSPGSRTAMSSRSERPLARVRRLLESARGLAAVAAPPVAAGRPTPAPPASTTRPSS